MNFFKRALSPFVTFDDDGKLQQTVATPTASTASVPLAAAPIPVFKGAPQAVDPAELEKFRQHFEQLMDEANLPGPDYYEFLKVDDKLTMHIPDERTRFMSAFASLAVQGLTKETLLSSAQTYIGILEKDRQGFDSALKVKIDAEIGGRKNQIAEKMQKIEEINEQIQTLGAEIRKLQQSANDLTAQTEEIESTYRKNAEGFAFAHGAMMQTIQNDIAKINSILQ